MAMSPLLRLERCGQSVWTDVVSRQMIRSGTLARYIHEDGISGVTANPSIFEKAIAGSHDYDETIRAYGAKGCTPTEIYEALAVEDVGTAADLLRPVYDRTDGADGFVSLEVSPELAHDTAATIAEAHRFWSELDRPNILIKVPATPAGIPAIEQLTADGINVNITLIFAVEVYEQVMEAYLRGLERRVDQHLPVNSVASVASFFVSRVDTLVDSLLDEKSREVDAGTRKHLDRLQGKAAVANAKVAYNRFVQIVSTGRFQRLAQKGARVQRPLWASTGTKNAAYPDTLYVAPLIGPDSVNTMTLGTIDAFKDHGTVKCGAILHGLDEAVEILDSVERAGIRMTTVTDQLTVEGVAKFTTSLHALLHVIEERQGSVVRL